jgi:hypothetical protein
MDIAALRGLAGAGAAVAEAGAGPGPDHPGALASSTASQLSMLLQSLAATPENTASTPMAGAARETATQAAALPQPSLESAALLRQVDTTTPWSVPSPGEAAAPATLVASDMAPLSAAPEATASTLPLPQTVPAMVTTLHLPPALGRRIERSSDPRDALPGLLDRSDGDAARGDDNDEGEDGADDDAMGVLAVADTADEGSGPTDATRRRAAADYRKLVQRLQAEGLQAALAELQQRRRLLIVLPVPSRPQPDRATPDVAIHLLTPEPRDAGQGWAWHYRGRGAWPALASGRSGRATTDLWKRWRLHREQAAQGLARLCVTRSPVLAQRPATNASGAPGAPQACALSLRLGAALLPPPLGHAEVAWLDVHEPQRLLRDLQGQWSVSLWWRAHR